MTDSSNVTSPGRSPYARVVDLQEFNDHGEPTARQWTFKNVHFLPLGYRDLLPVTGGQKIQIPIRMSGEVASGTDLAPDVIGKRMVVRSVMDSDFTSKSFALVRGGWLPSGMALQQGAIFMLDRCTVSDLCGHFSAGRKVKPGQPDFLDFFEADGVRINPLLYVLEGNTRAVPSLAQMREQLAEVTAKLSACLPRAHLIASDDAGLQGALGILKDTEAAMKAKQAFLLRVAPKVMEQVGRRRQDVVWDEILRTAKELKLSTQSLVVLAVLSAMLVQRGQNPAKKLLKPKPPTEYTTQDAYNAVSDLRMLELFACYLSLFPSQSFALCTGDKNLALFWAGIQASNFRWIGTFANYKVSPVEDLLPGLSTRQRASIFDSSEAR